MILSTIFQKFSQKNDFVIGIEGKKAPNTEISFLVPESA